MGVVANMRPDLFRAIVADVPFVDVINTMLDGVAPAHRAGVGAVGQPAQPRALRLHEDATRPTTTSRRRRIPSLLVTTSLNDSQVMYWEPAKWVAKLRATKTDSNPLYFKINLAGGHGGSSGRYDACARSRSATRSCSTRSACRRRGRGRKRRPADNRW